MIPRPRAIERLSTAIRRSPVTALLGPRQCGKTTLALAVAAGRESTVFDLESPRDVRRLTNPELMLASLTGLVVIDEIQRMPELLPVLRVLADRLSERVRFLILGSASPDLREGASESLAGRVEFVDLAGFGLDEVGPDNLSRLWVRGGFPRSYLADSDEDSFAWREGFVRTFLERDLPQFGVRTPAPVMRRFWTMLAHYHGQTWNASEIGRSLGQSDKTVASYLDTLTETWMVRRLQPWFENVGKRQVKAPKLYLRDSGILHSLLVLADLSQIAGHPKVGASWEGFAMEQVLTLIDPPQAYFWSVHAGAEIDLLLLDRGQRIGIEFKYSEAPTVTRSMRAAAETLRLGRLWIVTPGNGCYPLEPDVTVCGLASFSDAWRTAVTGA
jgi:uncharacterized protein